MRDCFSLLPPLPLASTARGGAASAAEKSGSSRWPPRSPRRCGSSRSKWTVRGKGGRRAHGPPAGRRQRPARRAGKFRPNGDSQTLPFRARWVVRWEAWERPRLCCPWGRGCWVAGSAACCASLPWEAAARAASTGPVRVAAAAALRSRLRAPPPGTGEFPGLDPRRPLLGGTEGQWRQADQALLC